MRYFKAGITLALTTLLETGHSFAAFWRIAMPWPVIYALFTLIHTVFSAGHPESGMALGLWVVLLLALLNFSLWNWLNFLQKRPDRLTWNHGWDAHNLPRFIALTGFYAIGLPVLMIIVISLLLRLIVEITATVSDAATAFIQWMGIAIMIGSNYFVLARLFPLAAFALTPQAPALPLMWQITKTRPMVTIAAFAIFSLVNAILAILLLSLSPEEGVSLVAVAFNILESHFVLCWSGILAQRLLEYYTTP